MDKFVNILKLSVGTDSVEGLAGWQRMRAAQMPDGRPRHVTRMFPKRRGEILAGGSIYWVIKGFIQCRQRIVALDEVVGDDGIVRCAIVLDPELHRTAPAKRRPFQGWRYLAPGDAPVDLGHARASDDDLPPELAGALAEIGVL